jgi:hypothetical protein
MQRLTRKVDVDYYEQRAEQEIALAQASRILRRSARITFSPAYIWTWLQQPRLPAKAAHRAAELIV